jgi:hypothetical protein
MTSDIGTHIIYSDGRIFSKSKNRFLRPHITAAGYYRVKIVRDNHLLHRLVAKAFIPNPENKPEVNHKDGNKLNAHVDNLEWVTPQENCLHSYAIGLQSKIGTKNVKAILTDEQVLEIRAADGNRHELAKAYGISVNTFHDIRSRRTWSHL